MEEEEEEGKYITPPCPDLVEQFVKERVESEEMLSEESITDPFPSIRVIFSNVVFRMHVRLSEKDEERDVLEMCLCMSGSF